MANLISGTAPTINTLWSEKAITMAFDIKIEHDIITVDCALSAYKSEHLAFVHMRALDFVRATVNVSAFAYGMGFTAVLDEVIDDSGICKPFLPMDAMLAQLFTAFDVNSPNWYNEVVKIVVAEPAIFMALDDLIVSITLPHHSTVNCARAVEGICKLIASGSPENKQWDKMHAALNTSKAYVSMITDYSKSGRHGDRVRIEGEITTEVVRRAWVIMNRFLAYRKGGNLPLSVSEYPFLA